MDENKWQDHTAKEQTLGKGCAGCAFYRGNGRDEQCPHHNGGPSCLPYERTDKRNIIWIDDVPAPPKPEPKVVYATVRDDFDENGEESGWSLECRFDDDQKYGAVTIDRPFPELARRICDFLNAPQEVKITLTQDERNAALRAISEAIPHKVADAIPWPPPPDRKTTAEQKYLHGAPTPDEIENFHKTGHVCISSEMWEVTKAMAEAFVTEPEPGDPSSVWEEWARNVEKFRSRYEALRAELP